MVRKFIKFIFRFNKAKRQSSTAQQHSTSSMASSRGSHVTAFREAQNTVTTDPLTLELPASSMSDINILKSPLEAGRDGWLGRQYLSCVVAQLLVVHSPSSDEESVLDHRLETIVTEYHYDKCYEFLLDQDIRRYDSQADNTMASSISYRQAILAWTGAILRRGDVREKQVLLVGLRRFADTNIPSLTTSGIRQATRAHALDGVTTDDGRNSADTTTTPCVPNDSIEQPTAHETGQPENGPVTPVQPSSSLLPDRPQDTTNVPLSHYTSALWEHLAGIGDVPAYAERRLFHPPCFHITATYGSLVGEGQDKNKRIARHKASKALCMSMQILVT